MKSNEFNELVNEILQSKIDIFLKYEEITNRMLTCDTDDLMACVGKRQDMALEIDALDKRLCTLYSSSGEESLKQAALNEIAWGECPHQLQDIFLNGQKLASIISRISREEQQVFSYVETQKDILLKLIKQQNTGVNAIASKYYSTSKNNTNNFTLFDNKY